MDPQGCYRQYLENVKKNRWIVLFLGIWLRTAVKWKKFQKQQLTLIDGIPVQPVIGDYESIKDDKYLNTELTFQIWEQILDTIVLAHGTISMWLRKIQHGDCCS